MLADTARARLGLSVGTRSSRAVWACQRDDAGKNGMGKPAKLRRKEPWLLPHQCRGAWWCLRQRSTRLLKKI